jgi:uncharacterized protein (TIGR00251 family)
VTLREVIIMSSTWFELRDGGVSLKVRVKPRSAKSRVLGERAGELEVAVAAPPVDGAANDELVAVLAEHFSVPKRDVTIVPGASGRSKIVRIACVPPRLR